MRELQERSLRQPHIEVERLMAPHIAILTHPDELARRISAFLGGGTLTTSGANP